MYTPGVYMANAVKPMYTPGVYMAFLTKGVLMLRHFKSLYLSIILLSVVTVSSGCALLVGAAAGAGGFAYVQGDLQKNFDYPLDRIHKASARALRDIKAVVISDETDKHFSRIKFTLEGDKGGEINIKSLTEKASKLSIRIGIFGDETESQMVLNAIMKNL